ncbi:MAG: formylglycine-generating enzyme family protein [Cyanobacteria bacterium REEB459]|nr:formylglycine-generating enzyme family protein [Cyanobacteria bacterium REEB459]
MAAHPCPKTLVHSQFPSSCIIINRLITMHWLTKRLRHLLQQAAATPLLRSSLTGPGFIVVPPSPTQLYYGRRRTLQILGYGGTGMGLALLGGRALAQGAGSKPVQPLPLPDLTSFSFEVITVNARGQVVARNPGQASSFKQPMGNGQIEMVALPGGQFLMGQSSAEKAELLRQFGQEAYSRVYAGELPQHPVSLAPFFMAKYPITHVQWRAVEALPKVKIDLSPDPLWFKGDNCPVELVSWKEAMEFCARLSAYSGRTYSLPSEAQWEYACRAGTTTPFHFGETVTTDIANYNGSSAYGAGPTGAYRQETTDVGTFPPNAFGLYDMHGNVWEWCLDHWHPSYTGAPANGSAWTTAGDSSFRILRGGSWVSLPRFCRSAYRDYNLPDYRSRGNGFRVVCSA